MRGTYAASEEIVGNELYPGMQAAFLEVSHHVDRGNLLDGGLATLLVDVVKNLAVFLEIHLYEVQEIFAVVGKELSDEEKLHRKARKHAMMHVKREKTTKILQQSLAVQTYSLLAV